MPTDRELPPHPDIENGWVESHNGAQLATAHHRHQVNVEVYMESRAKIIEAIPIDFLKINPKVVKWRLDSLRKAGLLKARSTK